MAGASSQLSRLTPDEEHQLGRLARRASVLVYVVVALMVLGTVGFALSEHVGVWYAFRWTLDTVSTVGGLREPRRAGGEIVQVALIVLGVGTLFYALATLVDFFVAGHLGELLASRRMQMSIDALSDHHIVCGYGRVGRQVARDLVAEGATCVVVDSNPESLAGAQAAGTRVVHGDASDEKVLLQAGIERARSIVVCADSDADNVFITLTARELRSEIAVVARAAGEDAEKKLRRAGADRVFSPYKTSGSEMARLALHRQLSGTLDVDGQWRIEEISVGADSAGEGMTIGELALGSVIVALRHGASLQPQPPSSTVAERGDVVIALGTPATLARLELVMETPADRAIR